MSDLFSAASLISSSAILSSNGWSTSGTAFLPNWLCTCHHDAVSNVSDTALGVLDTLDSAVERIWHVYDSQGQIAVNNVSDTAVRVSCDSLHCTLSTN